MTVDRRSAGDRPWMAMGKESHQAPQLRGLTCGGPEGQGFGDVAHVLDSSISDDGNTEAPCVL